MNIEITDELTPSKKLTEPQKNWQKLQNLVETRQNPPGNRTNLPTAGGSSTPKKGPLKLLDYHKKYFPAYEKLYYSNPKNNMYKKSK